MPAVSALLLCKVSLSHCLSRGFQRVQTDAQLTRTLVDCFALPNMRFVLLLSGVCTS